MNGRFCRVGPSQAIDIMNEGQINGTFWSLRIAFSYLKSVPKAEDRMWA